MLLRRYKQQLQLKDYHNWFTDLVSGWIDAAAQKCNIEIKRAITALDNVNYFTCTYVPSYVCMCEICISLLCTQ